MKKFKITFTEQELIQFEQLIGEIATKWGNPLINLYASKIETLEEDTRPIGGGGGAPIPRPKKSE